MNAVLNAIPGVAQARAAFAAGKAWAWVAAVLVLIAFGFYFGKLYGEKGLHRAEAAQDKIAHDRDAWRSASEGWQLASEAWAKRNREDEKRRSEQQAQAARVLDQLARMDAAQKAEEQAWRKRFKDAGKIPACAEMAKETACPLFIDY